MIVDLNGFRIIFFRTAWCFVFKQCFLWLCKFVKQSLVNDICLQYFTENYDYVKSLKTITNRGFLVLLSWNDPVGHFIFYCYLERVKYLDMKLKWVVLGQGLRPNCILLLYLCTYLVLKITSIYTEKRLY